jgi:hypothetical protein
MLGLIGSNPRPSRVFLLIAWMVVLGVSSPAGSAQVSGGKETATSAAGDWADRAFWVDVAQFVTAAAAVFAAIAIPLQLRANRRQARETRTADYYRRFQEPGFSELSSRAWSFLRAEGTAERVRRRQAWSAATHGNERSLPCGATALESRFLPRASPNDVWITVSFFEEMAEAYNAGLLDQHSVARLFRTVIRQFYEPMEWFGEVLDAEFIPPEAEAARQKTSPYQYRRRKSSRPLAAWGLMLRQIEREAD